VQEIHATHSRGWHAYKSLLDLPPRLFDTDGYEWRTWHFVALICQRSAVGWYQQWQRGRRGRTRWFMIHILAVTVKCYINYNKQCISLNESQSYEPRILAYAWLNQLYRWRITKRKIQKVSVHAKISLRLFLNRATFKMPLLFTPDSNIKSVTCSLNIFRRKLKNLLLS